MAMAANAVRQSSGHWLLRWWLTLRVAIGTSLAEAAVIWLGVESLSNRSVGSIAFGPVIVAMLLLGVAPVVGLRRSANRRRTVGAVAILVSAVVLVKGLSFPHLGWLDRSWLTGIGPSLIVRDSPALMPVWVPILIVTGAWLWRQRRGDQSTEDIRITLRLGAILLIASAAIGAFTGLEREQSVATAATVFFAAVLLSMSWARQAAVHPGELSGGGAVATLSSVASVVVVLLLATALVAVTTPSAFETLVRVFAPLVWLIQIAILGLSWLFLIILFPVFWFASWLLSLRSNQDRPEETPRVFDNPSPSPVAAQTPETATLPDDVRVILAAIVLTVLVLLVARQALRRVATVAELSDVEQHVEMDLRSLFRRRRGRPLAAVDPLAGLRDDPRYRNTIAIRETYARFLRAAAQSGLDRRRSETARHHAQRVADTLGTSVDDIRLLTGTYGTIRYDDVPATDEQRRSVSTAWERVAPYLTARAAASRDESATGQPFGRRT